MAKCGKCGWFGHSDHEHDALQKKKAERNKPKFKKQKRAQAHQTIEEVQEDDMVFSSTMDVDECNSSPTPQTLAKEGNNIVFGLYDWIADTATTSHITNMREAFQTFQPLRKYVSGVGDAQAEAEGRGTVKIQSVIEGKSYFLTLEDVLYIPSNPNNLLSLGRWDKAGGEYHASQGRLTLTAKDGRKMAKGTRVRNNLYKMDDFTIYKAKATSSAQAFQLRDAPATWETWHRRFGHIGLSGLQRLQTGNLATGFDVDLSSPKYDCTACIQAKQHVEPFPTESEPRSTKPGDLTHTDLWGKCSVQSIHGNLYFQTFLDDASRRPRIRFLKSKDEAPQAIKDYVTHLRTQGRNPRAFRFDRGKEFMNESLLAWLQERGIEAQPTAGYSPSQNGAAERLNRTLVELARAMLLARSVPTFLWEYAILHAAYLRERVPTKALSNTTPYQEWYGTKPDVTHLREFGSPVYVLIQGHKDRPKLLPKSQQQIFVGYTDGSKSIKFYNPQTRNILTSRNYVFPRRLPEREATPEPILLESLPAGPREGEQSKELLRQPERAESNTNKRQMENANIENPSQSRKLRTKAPINYRYLNDPFPDEEQDETHLLTPLQHSYHAILGTDDPKTVAEAKTLEDWPEWEKAIKAELDQLEHFGTWDLVDCPTDAVPIPNKWVFLKKYNKQGELQKHKARLVVKGCAQRPGFDYTDTFSPVVRLETIRAILSIVPCKDLRVQQMDVKGAYLNGTLQENVYMRQPEGFGDGTSRVCRLRKTLYGLKQSGREWNRELDKQLRNIGFKKLQSDPCTYVQRNEDKFRSITVWVDDLLLFATWDEGMANLKMALEKIFDVTDLGDPSRIVGIEITRTKETLTISQPLYIDSILRKYGMEHANPVSTPLDPNHKLEPNKEIREPNRSNDYASLIGSLQYLAIATRPDIAFAVNRLASYTANPSLEHYGAAKRLLRYIKGTRDYGITYHTHANRHLGPPDTNIVYGFSDAAFANTDDRKSTSGYVFMSNGGAITWGSKKQTTIALSSTEAEYVALSEAAREAMWLYQLYGELGYPQTDPILILGDNNGSIAMAKNPEFHKRSKHVDIRWHWVRDLVNDGYVNIVDCRDPEQTADVLTKALTKPKFTRHVNELGLSTV